jgi:uncharacterized membrane protein
MIGAEFLTWLHLCAMAAYVGAQFAVIYMLIPAAETAPNEAARRSSLIAGFKFYNPFTIAVLGVVVISGATRLTDLKASMKFDYFARIGSALELKLALAFVLIFIQTYITFGLAFRIGRQEEVAAHGDGEAFTVEQVNSMLRRIRAMAWFTIVLAAAVIWVSLTMVSRAVGEPGTQSRTLAHAPSRRTDRAAKRAVTLGMLGRPRPWKNESHGSVREREQRTQDVHDGDDAENRARDFVQHVVLCEPSHVADGSRLVDRCDSRESCFVGSCVHFQILPCSVTDLEKQLVCHWQNSRFDDIFSSQPVTMKSSILQEMLQIQ